MSDHVTVTLSGAELAAVLEFASPNAYDGIFVYLSGALLATDGHTLVVRGTRAQLDAPAVFVSRDHLPRRKSELAKLRKVPQVKIHASSDGTVVLWLGDASEQRIAALGAAPRAFRASIPPVATWTEHPGHASIGVDVRYLSRLAVIEASDPRDVVQPWRLQVTHALDGLLASRPGWIVVVMPVGGIVDDPRYQE